MIHLLRKYRKWVLWGLVILVVPTFVVWGGYRKGSNRGGGEGQPVEGAVAKVGSVPIPAVALQRALAEESDRRGQYGQRPTLKQMAEDGTANRVLDNLIDTAMVEDMEARREFTCERELLAEQFKDSPMFKTDSGEFDARAWNSFIEARTDRNWNAIYTSMNAQLKRNATLELLKAPGRVLDADIQDQFDEENSKIQVKYIEVEAKVDVTDEQIKAKYDADPKVYQSPAKQSVDFVGVSLIPPMPAEMDEVAKKAKAGEDFSELAKAHSVWPSAKEDAGDLGWVREGANMPDHQKVIMTLPVGGVSDPIGLPGSYFLFKVEEERTDPTSNLREVKARQIVIEAKLTDAELSERQAKAQSVLDKAKAAGDLAAAAAEAGLEMKTTAMFSIEDREIEPLPRGDVYTFRTGFENLPEGEYAGPIKSREFLYVGRVKKVEPPVIRPLEEVKDRVKNDVDKEIRASEEHIKKTEALCKEIAGKAKSLQDILTQYPDMGFTVKDTPEFTVKEKSIMEGTLLRSSELYQAIKGKAAGAFAGPVKGLRTEQYFVEVVKLTPPSDEEWPAEKRDAELKKLREDALQMAQNRVLMDFLKFQRTHVAVDYKNDVFAQVVGTGAEEEKAPEAADDAAKEPGPVGARPAQDEDGPVE